jgi:hypothetical protein
MADEESGEGEWCLLTRLREILRGASVSFDHRGHHPLSTARVESGFPAGIVTPTPAMLRETPSLSRRRTDIFAFFHAIGHRRPPTTELTLRLGVRGCHACGRPLDYVSDGSRWRAVEPCDTAHEHRIEVEIDVPSGELVFGTSPGEDLGREVESVMGEDEIVVLRGRARESLRVLSLLTPHYAGRGIIRVPVPRHALSLYAEAPTRLRVAHPGVGLLMRNLEPQRRALGTFVRTLPSDNGAVLCRDAGLWPTNTRRDHTSGVRHRVTPGRYRVTLSPQGDDAMLSPRTCALIERVFVRSACG